MSVHSEGWPHMSDSRVIDQESRRQVREDLLTNILLEAGAGSGKTQMLAERMAAGVAAGVYSAQGRWPPLRSPAKLLPNFAAAASTSRSKGSYQGPLTCLLSGPIANRQADRLRLALANMERFFQGEPFTHSCARLLRERPVESGVSPGFTELDEVQDFELRQRVWRDFISNGRGAGDPVLLALLEAGIRPQDLDSAFCNDLCQ